MNASPAPSLVADMFSGPTGMPRGRTAIAKVVVLDTMAEGADAWDRLERRSPASPYQSFALNEIWLQTIGRNQGIEPALILAEDANGHPLALLPLGIRRRAGLRCAAFLGGSDFNGNLALFNPATEWDRQSLEMILAQGAERARIDIYHLQHQRQSWSGVANPLLSLGGQPSASTSHAAELAKDPDAFFTRTLSKHARKLQRQKRGKLQAIGNVQHMRARTRAEADAILARYVGQKQTRFDKMGVRALRFAEALGTFLEQACDPETATGPLVELHALLCGDRIVATFGGTGRNARFSGMFVSFDDSVDVARCSPGDLLLSAVMAEKCREGFESFDLGIGEARYKDVFCPRVEPLFDQFIGVTARGRIAEAVLSMLARQKRRLKQTPWLWSAVKRARRFRRGAPRR